MVEAEGADDGEVAGAGAGAGAGAVKRNTAVGDDLADGCDDDGGGCGGGGGIFGVVLTFTAAVAKTRDDGEVDSVDAVMIPALSTVAPAAAALATHSSSSNTNNSSNINRLDPARLAVPCNLFIHPSVEPSSQT
jgi:hypothetical protein